jgi:hypothetical protein
VSTRTVTRTIRPRYVNQGNTHHYRTPAYKRTSTLGGKFQHTDAEIKWRLFWRSMRGGAGLCAGGVVAILSIVAFAGGA